MTELHAGRRQFLRATAAGALTAPAILEGTAAEAGPTTYAPVMIIGAGMSGVSTAHWLRQFGIPSIILEGRKRMGGRLWSSDHWPDAILDMGGAWIHDSRHSPLTPLVQRFNIPTVETDYTKSKLRTADGTTLDLFQTAALGLDYAAVMEEVRFNAEARQAQGLRDEPLENGINAALRQARLSPFELQGVNALIATNQLLHSGTSLKRMSLYHFEGDKNVVGDHDRAFPGGYDQLVKKLAEGQKILYEHVVQRVIYNEDGVIVDTNRGRFVSEVAVVTLPLGVLRAGTVKFHPMLPTRKRAAIARLNVGTVDKLALRFPTPFWNTAAAFIVRVSPQFGYFTPWLNAMPITRRPILIGFVTGALADELESESEGRVVDTQMNILRRWFGRKIPKPIGFQRSQWHEDRFAYGSYPQIPPGASGADYDIMSEPVPYAPNLSADANRLFFAGDATHRDHPTSAWGAYETGQREAQRIRALFS